MEVSVLEIYGTAFRTVFRKFGQLVLVTAIPLILYLVTNGGLIYFSILQHQLRLANLKQQQSGTELLSGPIKIVKVIQPFQWETWVLTAILIFVLLWLIFRVTRWHLHNQGFRTVSGEFPSYLNTCLYGGAIYVILSSPLLLAIAWLYSKTGTVSFPTASLLFGMLGSTGLGFALIWCISVLTAYIFVRFWIAVPAIMLGHCPHFFRGMWPFAKPIAWKFIGVGILYGLGIGIAFAAILFPIMFLSFNFQHFQWNFMFQSGINALINIPLYWFWALLYAEAYARLSKTNGQAKDAV